MIRSSLIVLGFVIALPLGFVPEKVEAAGDIQLDCWSDLPPGIGPIHTVGCTLSWFPVPPAQGAQRVIWYRAFDCVDPNCQVFGNPAPLFFDLLDPPADTHHDYIRANCTGRQQIVAVLSDAISYGARHNVQFIRERLHDEEAGIVTITTFSPLCPFVGGGVSVG